METTELLETGSVQAPISVYFGLEPGNTANLEVVAEAALAWVAAVREMAFIVDPSLEVRVEIVDGDQGSLWLNLLTAIESKLERIERGSERWPRLYALAKGLAYIVVGTPIAISAEDVWRSVVKDSPAIVESLSPEARRELIEDFRKVLQEETARPQKQQFFQAAAKDTKIKSVGVSNTPHGEPKLIASREQFTHYAKSGSIEHDTERTRKRTESWEVTLISPVLEGSERSWRFLYPGLPEFGAVMRDRPFLQAIETGGVHVELRKGIKMEVEIQFKERLTNGVWKTEERSILKVLSPGYDRGEFEFSRPAT